MKKTRKKIPLLLLPLCLMLAIAATPVCAENVVYPDAPLQTVEGNTDSLAPSGSDGASGYSKSASLTYNNVVFNSGVITGNVYGAVNGIVGDTGSVTNNRVFINGGNVGENVYGGYSDSGAATGNIVTVNGGTMESVHGGVSDSGAATGNTVTVNGGNVGEDVYGGVSFSGVAATGNTVTINGGNVGDNVYGGVSDSGVAAGNTVTINGGAFDQNSAIYGGYSNNGSATGNTVTISGAPTMSGVSLYGGAGTNSGDAFTGNVLNIRTSGALTVDGLQNFQYLNFFLPAAIQPGDTMLTVNTQYANLTGAVGNIQGNRSSIINVGVDGARSPLQVGNWFTLIDATASGNLISNAGLKHTATGLHGATLLYDFGIDVQGNQYLRATVLGGPRANPRARALSDGYLAGLALAGGGVDLADGREILKHGKGVFALVSGGVSRYDAGSRIDLKGASLLAGISGGADLGAGRLTYAGFFSGGRGSYDTRGTFPGAPDVNGSGDADYAGLGVLARLDFNGNGAGHNYAEAHIQGGRVSSDFHSADLTDARGTAAGYDASSGYFGGHLGVGRVKNFGDRGELDLYAKYLYTRRGGDSVTLTTGDPVDFDAVNSHRLRLGGRYTWNAGNVRPYAGLAWEHEFDGESRASAWGYPLPASSVDGGTGILELGFTLEPSPDNPLRIDFGVRGYAGAREGVTGSLRAEYAF